jgi:hypothetical protein
MTRTDGMAEDGLSPRSVAGCRAVMVAALGAIAVGACATPKLPAPTASPSEPATAAPSGTSAAGVGTVSMTLVAERAAHTAITLPSGEVFVAGGCVVDGCGKATQETFILLPDGLTATRGPVMAQPRDGHTATLTPAGDVVLAGGFSGEGQGALESIELFDPETLTIRALAPLAQARGGQAAAALPDGRVLVVGGWIASHTYTASAELVDPAAGTVSRAPDLPWAADALDAVALRDGRVLVTGGQIRPAQATDQAAIYDPATSTWTAGPPMSNPRFKHVSLLLDDGRVLIIGGTGDDEHLLSSTEIFDPTTSIITEGPALHEGRYKLTGGAVALAGNRVLVAGGGRSVELLDVNQGTSRVIHSTSQRGSFTTVNRWGAEGFIVLGGYDEWITLRRDYWIVSAAELGLG